MKSKQRRISENNIFAGIKSMTFKVFIIHGNNSYFGWF